jgi:hypothetical protein
MTDLAQTTLPSSSDMGLHLVILGTPMGQTPLCITITVSTIRSLGRRSELWTSIQCQKTDVCRYGDPGFHRHVDAAKILGLLCQYTIRYTRLS